MTTNLIDKECNKILAQTFYKNAGYSLKKGNGYSQTILEPKFAELDEKVKDIYPEYYQAYKAAKESYLEEFKMMYSEEKKANKESENQELGA